MNFSFDIRDDVRYKQGLEVGRIIWKVIVIRNLLKHQITSDSKIIASILHESIEFVEQTKDELKKETKIIKALSVKGASVNSLAKKFKVSKTFIWTLKEIVEQEKLKV